MTTDSERVVLIRELERDIADAEGDSSTVAYVDVATVHKVIASLSSIPAQQEEVTEAQLVVAQQWIDGGFRIPNCAERVAFRASVAAMQKALQP